MRVYPQSEDMTVGWPEPVESGWQMLGGDTTSGLAPKLPHLGLADVLFMSMVMAIPRPVRPWGIVSWMAEVFKLSRPALYALSERTKERLLSCDDASEVLPDQTVNSVEVTPTRLVRTVLTASLPGKTAIRPLQKVLQAAFDQTRSVGWISERLTEAGRQAGEVLERVDTSPLGAVIAARDETFFHNQPLLLVIDPVTTTILQAQVCADRQAETWGTVLLMVEEQGVQIKGLVEDMARMYPKSQKEAEMEAVPVQKDVWHVERDGGQVLRDLERAALRATGHVCKLEKCLQETWDEALFDDKYVAAVAAEERLYDQHAAFAQALSHLVDALELVDWRSGEIRTRAINTWLLEETLLLMEAIDHKRVLKWAKTLRNHQPQLLTALDWLHDGLQPVRHQLAQHLSPSQQSAFVSTVSRHWRLQQALINGHAHFRTTTHAATNTLHALLADHPQRRLWADQICAVLNAACRTSSMIENVNGLLKQFLHTHKAFRSPETLQLYLNLFVLWHNLRPFERGKRAGHSPYQLAGIDLGSDDWLALLGYPAA